MKFKISFGIIIAALLLVALAVPTAYGGTNGQGISEDVVPDSYIVVLREGASAADVVSDHGVARKHAYAAVFNGFSGKVPPGRVAALRNDPRVVSVSANHRVHADPKPDKPGGGKGGGGGKNKPLVVEIVTPADGAAFASGTTIDFEGGATDDIDEGLTASLVWTSDPGGQIGTGGSFSTALVDDAYTIAASVTDSGGKTGNDSISITVGSAPDPTPAPGNQVVPSGVARISAAPGSLSQTVAGVGVAIVGSGIDFGHSDLTVSSVCFTAYASCQDDAGHGTHVAGIVAARDNDSDVVGVAPGATLYAVKVLDSSGSGDWDDVLAGLEWILAKSQLGTLDPPIRVVNMSLGSPVFPNDGLIGTAIKNLHDAGMSVVVSAGNEASDEVTDRVPARLPDVMAIASTTALDGTGPSKGPYSGMQTLADTASYFTTDGSFDPTTGVGVTVSAPGEAQEDIDRRCGIRGSGVLSLQLGGGTTRMSGTSMAAPHVAGVVVLMVEQTGGALDPETARSKLQISADRQGTAPLGSPTGSYSFDGVKGGILSAAAALAAP